MSTNLLTEDELSGLPEEVQECLPIPSQLSEVEFVEWTLRHEKIRAEWVNGEVIFMSPVSARHVRICLWLDRILGTYVQERDLGEVLGSELAIRLQTPQRLSRRFPDLMFVHKERLHLVLKNHLEGPPDLAIEIVSPDSEKRDWTDKLTEYEAAGVREYWIIDPVAEEFGAFSLNAEGKFASIHNQPAGLFASQVVDRFQFQVEWLWQAELPSVFTVLRGLNLL